MLRSSAAGGSDRKKADRYELLLKAWDADPGSVWGARAVDGEPPGALALVHDLPFRSGMTEEISDALVEAWEWTAEAKHERVIKAEEPIIDEIGVAVASPYVEGEPLGSLLRLASVRRLVFPAPAALRVAVDVLEGLSYLHGRAAEMSVGPEAVFGGLHPNNVIIGADGKTRILEPGIGAAISHQKAFAEDPKRAAYSAPEQFDDGEAIDATCDLFCMGILLWEQMLGKRLFGALSLAAVRKKVTAQPIERLDAAKPAGGVAIEAAIADIVARALERDRAARFQSAGEMLEAIQSAGQPIGSHDDVAQVLAQLAGKALSARKASFDKAMAGEGGPESSKAAPGRRTPTPGAPRVAPTRPGKAPPAPTGGDSSPDAGRKKLPPPPRVGGTPQPPRAKPVGLRPGLPPKRTSDAGRAIDDPQTVEGDLVDESPAPTRPAAPRTAPRAAEDSGPDADEEPVGTEWEGPLSEQAPVPPADDDDDDDDEPEEEELATAVMTAEEAMALAAAGNVELPVPRRGAPRPGAAKETPAEKDDSPEKTTGSAKVATPPPPEAAVTDARFDDSAHRTDDDEVPPVDEEAGAKSPADPFADGEEDGSQPAPWDEDADLDGGPAADEAGGDDAPEAAAEEPSDADADAQAPAASLAKDAASVDLDEVDGAADAARRKKQRVIVGGILAALVVLILIVWGTSDGGGASADSAASATATASAAATTTPAPTTSETVTESAETTTSTETATEEEDAGAAPETSAAPTAAPPPRTTGGGTPRPPRPPRPPKDKPPPRYVPDDL